MRYIELQYLSPASNYEFDENKTYTLVLINISSNNNIHIYKNNINKLDNVNATTRAYPIKKSVKVVPSLFKQSYCVKLFSHDNETNKISLLFTGVLDQEKLDKENYNYIVLDKPPTVLGRPREVVYVDDTSYLEEPFYNFENLISKESCFFFIRKMRNTNFKVLLPIAIKFDLSNSIYLYNRYHNSIVKEFMPRHVHTIIDKIGYNTIAKQNLAHSISFINNFCNNKNTYEGYIKFLEIYQRDDRTLIGQQKLGNLKFMLTRRIQEKYRPLKIEPYLNNTVVAPVDGRVRGFHTTSNLKIVIYNRIYTPGKFRIPEIIGGSGFLCRVTPQDYQRVHMPFAAYIKTLNVFVDNDKTCITTLEFESTYFMPPDVHQRDYLSVINGNYTHGGVGVGVGVGGVGVGGVGVGAGSRSCPEVLEVQPKTHLSFHIIIISPTKDSFIFTNKKLETSKNQTLKQKWYEQGEELGKIMCGNACIVVLFNRRLDFTPDIKYFSKIDSMTPIHKPIDTYVKTRDIVGLIK